MRHLQVLLRFSRGQLSLLTAFLAACVALGLAASVVSAHVGVTPNKAPADTSQTFTIRVPVEKEEATVKLRVEFPAGLTVSRFQSKPGWKREVERDSQQRIIAATWSGSEIAPGEYEDFIFTARTPKEAGKLAFKAYQTYKGGETVNWTDGEGSQRPAAIVEVSPASGASAVDDHGATSPSVQAAANSANPASAQVLGATSTGSDLPLFAAMAALVLAAIALVLAAVALMRRPRAA